VWKVSDSASEITKAGQNFLFSSRNHLPPVQAFREGNCRATRIWLDLILKQEIRQVVDWNQIDKEDYLIAMQRSVVKDIEIKHFLKQALTLRIDDREFYLKGIDVSY